MNNPRIAPPLPTPQVLTIQDAVEISLKAQADKRLFVFARAIKTFEQKVKRVLTTQDLGSAFALWWSRAKALLPANAEFDEYRFCFLDSFERTRHGLGANVLEEAKRRAESESLPSCASNYSSSSIKRLIAVCYQLHALQSGSPFFLSARDAAKIAGTASPTIGNQLLRGLVRDGVLVEVQKGVSGGRHATRFTIPG